MISGMASDVENIILEYITPQELFALANEIILEENTSALDAQHNAIYHLIQNILNPNLVLKNLQNNGVCIFRKEGDLPFETLARTLNELSAEVASLLKPDAKVQLAQIEKDCLQRIKPDSKKPINICPFAATEDLITLNEMLDQINHRLAAGKLPAETATVKAIDLSDLGLTRLPGTLGTQLEQYPHFRELSLSSNALRHLPRFICSFSNLQDLVLSNNVLLDLPEEFGELSDLTRILAVMNRLCTLPQSMAKLTKLQTLLLTCNPIASVDASLTELLNRTNNSKYIHCIAPAAAESDHSSSSTFSSSSASKSDSVESATSELAQLSIAPTYLPANVAQKKAKITGKEEKQDRPASCLVLTKYTSALS